MSRIVTLDEFIIRRQKDFPYASGELTGLLRDIGVAAKIVNREVNKAGLVNILGEAREENASGDTVQKLDLYANEKLIDCLKNSGECCGVASEELEDIIPINSVASKASKYVVVFDPLDGSSNIDVNVSVGTIFGIYRRLSDAESTVEVEDFLQRGIDLVAAGYVLYGTSTLLVYTTGRGVNGFTLDPTIGEFCLSHTDIQIPDRGNYYSVNQGYYLKFDVEMRRYIDHCSDLNLRLRYIGSMVSDIHRILFQGGIFLYPNTRKYPQGKLRLVYECNPLAYIVEQAGGKAITCQLERILELEVNHLHQRATIAIGSPGMVDEMKAFVERYSAIPVFNG
ncbi:class 1 fructose-bisphosphatase [Phaeodactylibacter xiamenensis]|jgi:fructose-1,6-bisphosphatase I|uniref:Fructose-1,6-bisphosphatase class 1 n=1 Tax=Phaeodactylibacter xiamenensis TaxID=1524460 RepID=A0A098RZC6_9BACT|nr:class 1 fructose-bisphosphatase [Phaeodactylibacter xiamenensis]KGE85489.1 fructose 1,6-bisphosphatase [Phaeodactylibacter xiamenensis]MCR9053282.1 class 1 fructose-bisphosphatase [bacterium]